MSFIKVKGFPQNASLPFILHKLRGLFPVKEVGKFWIQEISDVGPDCREATIEVSTQQNVIAALKYLDQFTFTVKGGTSYSLIAYQDFSSAGDKILKPKYKIQNPRDKIQRPRDKIQNPGDKILISRDKFQSPRDKFQSLRDERNIPRDQRQSSRDNYYHKSSDDDHRRPQSPEYHSDCGYTNSDFDIEMDLLRQQTKIMEQERKLLLKKKKLELLQEYGPDALNELSDSPPRRQEIPSRYDRGSFINNEPGFRNISNATVNNTSAYSRHTYSDNVTNASGSGRDTYNDNVTGFTNPQDVNDRKKYSDNEIGFNNQYDVRGGVHNDIVTGFNNAHDVVRDRDTCNDNRFEKSHGAKVENRSHGRGIHNDIVTGFVNPQAGRVENPGHCGSGTYNDNGTRFEKPHGVRVENRSYYRFKNPQDGGVENPSHYGSGTYNDNVTRFENAQDEGVEDSLHYGSSAYNDNGTRFENPQGLGVQKPLHYGRDTYNDNGTRFENPQGLGAQKPLHYGRDTYNDNGTRFENPQGGGVEIPAYGSGTYNDKVTGFGNADGVRVENRSHYDRDTYNDNVTGFENPQRGRGEKPSHYGRNTYNDNIIEYNNPHGARLENSSHYSRDTYNDRVTSLENAHGARVENPPRFDVQSYNDNVHGFKNPRSYDDEIKDTTGFNNPNNSVIDSPGRYNDNIPGFENPHGPKRPRYDDEEPSNWQPKRSSLPPIKTFPNQKTGSKPNSIQNSPKPFGKPSKLPQFKASTIWIMTDVEKVFPHNISKAEKSYLVNTISKTIRTRISVALQGMDRKRTFEIINLYRSLYPTSLDAKLVEKTRAGFKPKRPQVQLTKHNNGGHGSRNNGLGACNNDGNRASNAIFHNQEMAAGNTASRSGKMNQGPTSMQINHLPGQYGGQNELQYSRDYSLSPGDLSWDLGDNGEGAEDGFDNWI